MASSMRLCVASISPSTNPIDCNVYSIVELQVLYELRVHGSNISNVASTNKCSLLLSYDMGNSGSNFGHHSSVPLSLTHNVSFG